ncbi:MAG: hypothetical protein IJ007_06955 [Oscillospiraceae bacterium]|nr:hypothetical protein [Oscillospiraceae bacterium]
MDRKYNIIADEAAVKLAEKMSAGFTEEKLIAAANKGIYKRALKDIDSGEFHAEADGEFIKIMLADAEVSMCGDISQCRCNCASKTVCRHIVSAAVLLSQFSDGSDIQESVSETNEEVIPEKEPSSPEADKVYLNMVLDSAKSILSKGIISCSESDAETMERLSLTAPSVHRSISRLCRSFAEDIKLMLEKSAAFSQTAAAVKLCRIYNTAEVSLKEQGKALLFSGNDYTGMGRGDFLCLGVYPFRSRSGFAGITAVLFETEQGKFYTYNTAVSDIYSKTADAGDLKSLQKLLRAHSHWQNNMSVENISGRKIILTGCKADENGKLSSSKQTACSVSERVSSEKLPEGVFEFAPEEEYDYFSAAKNPRYAVIRSMRVGNVYFDKGEQILYYTVFSDDSAVPCETAYSSQSSFAVKNIEDYGKEDKERYFLLKRFGTVTQIVSEIAVNGVYNIYFGNRWELTV